MSSKTISHRKSKRGPLTLRFTQNSHYRKVVVALLSDASNRVSMQGKHAMRHSMAASNIMELSVFPI